MPISLADALIAEKNALGDAGAWIILIQLDLDSTLSLAQNTEDVNWNGYMWARFPVVLDVIGETSQGEIPQIVARVDNRSQALQAELEAIDGGTGAEVTIYLVHSENLNETEVPSWSLYVTGCRLDAEWATFTLGTENPFNKLWPPDRILKAVCRHKFKSSICGYTGGQTSCDKTLTRCRVLARSEYFGGFPGVGSGVIFI